MTMVVEASIVAVWAFPDEISSIALDAAAIINKRPGLVSALFWFEVRNMLLFGERRGRISVKDVSLFLHDLDGLALNVDRNCTSDRLLHLARLHGLTAYDAAYLELAERRGALLATLDRRLAIAALASGVEVLGHRPSPDLA